MQRALRYVGSAAPCRVRLGRGQLRAASDGGARMEAAQGGEHRPLTPALMSQIGRALNVGRGGRGKEQSPRGRAASPPGSTRAAAPVGEGPTTAQQQELDALRSTLLTGPQAATPSRAARGTDTRGNPPQPKVSTGPPSGTAEAKTAEGRLTPQRASKGRAKTQSHSHKPAGVARAGDTRAASNRQAASSAQAPDGNHSSTPTHTKQPQGRPGAQGSVDALRSTLAFARDKVEKTADAGVQGAPGTVEEREAGLVPPPPQQQSSEQPAGATPAAAQRNAGVLLSTLALAKGKLPRGDDAEGEAVAAADPAEQYTAAMLRAALVKAKGKLAEGAVPATAPELPPAQETAPSGGAHTPASVQPAVQPPCDAPTTTSPATTAPGGTAADTPAADADVVSEVSMLQAVLAKAQQLSGGARAPGVTEGTRGSPKVLGKHSPSVEEKILQDVYEGAVDRKALPVKYTLKVMSSARPRVRGSADTSSIDDIIAAELRGAGDDAVRRREEADRQEEGQKQLAQQRQDAAIVRRLRDATPALAALRDHLMLWQEHRMGHERAQYADDVLVEINALMGLLHAEKEAHVRVANADGTPTPKELAHHLARPREDWVGSLREAYRSGKVAPATFGAFRHTAHAPSEFHDTDFATELPLCGALLSATADLPSSAVDCGLVVRSLIAAGGKGRLHVLDTSHALLFDLPSHPLTRVIVPFTTLFELHSLIGRVEPAKERYESLLARLASPLATGQIALLPPLAEIDCYSINEAYVRTTLEAAGQSLSLATPDDRILLTAYRVHQTVRQLAKAAPAPSGHAVVQLLTEDAELSQRAGCLGLSSSQPPVLF